MPRRPRKTAKNREELPPEIREQVDRLLVEGGSSMEEIRDFVAAQGYDFSRTAFARYGNDFLAAYTRLRVIEDKSRVLAGASGANEGLLLEEAASKLFARQIIEAQLAGEIDLAALPRLLSDFAKLQASTVLREKMKREFQRRVEKAAEEVSKDAAGKGLSEAAAEEIRRKILGIAE